MKVYRIEHQRHKIGPFRSHLKGIHVPDKVLDDHANWAIPAPWDDFSSGHTMDKKQVYAFTSMRWLRHGFNKVERRELARRGFVLTCYMVSDHIVGRSGMQCSYPRHKAKLLWMKKL